MPDQINHFESETGTIEPFDRTYHEVLDLLEEARDFARAGNSHPECQMLEGMDRLIMTCEAFRITSRLGQCLAWIMLHRAVRHGEITEDALRLPENRIGGEPVCNQIGHEDDPKMPRRLRELLHQSRALYERLCRLDQGIPG
jgi:regulator of CtrA degradation